MFTNYEFHYPFKTGYINIDNNAKLVNTIIRVSTISSSSFTNCKFLKNDTLRNKFQYQNFFNNTFEI